ncbi:hypothetical protein [Streptomyces sp. NPDC088358]|uniref:hypothetical protein n=1 Tax=Streptomyces sp. NPDC088358 TaxID=3365857 RepID=UPI0037F11ED5
MITLFFEPRAEDDFWSPDRRPEKPELTGADFSMSCFQADVSGRRAARVDRPGTH